MVFPPFLCHCWAEAKNILFLQLCLMVIFEGGGIYFYLSVSYSAPLTFTSEMKLRKEQEWCSSSFSLLHFLFTKSRYLSIMIALADINVLLFKYVWCFSIILVIISIDPYWEYIICYWTFICTSSFLLFMLSFNIKCNI